jgi:hypothetical protein
VRDRFRCDGSGNPLPVNAQRQQDQTMGVPCNKIPQALINAPMQEFFRTYSATPNYAVAGTVQNFIQGRPVTNNSNSFQIRADHRFNDRQRVLPLRAPRVGPHAVRAGGVHRRRVAGELGRQVIILSVPHVADVRAGYAGRPAWTPGQQNTHPAGVEALKRRDSGSG